ncbi:MAG: chorismate lyase [Gammaproteobacteria bacterium]|nr:chorismate lyase [Gammaproteobacteria bacterium]
MKTWNTPAWRAGDWRGWLDDHGSLTRRLQAICPHLRVQRLSQHIAPPLRDEYRALGLRRGERALIRDVLLICGDTPLVYAHSVIPLPGLYGPWVALSRLGNRPLGAALFANPKVRRFPLEYRQLDARHPLYRPAVAHLEVANLALANLAEVPRRLWMRRSQFALAGHPLLVTEVFLPAISQYPAPNSHMLK